MSGCLVLASGSPRRRELLAERGYLFSVVLPDDAAESGEKDGEIAAEHALRMAYQKVRDVAHRHPAGLYLGCDTVVECAGERLGKPKDRDDARRILRKLRSRPHRVFSGICLWRRPDDAVATAVDETYLTMDDVSDAELERYLDSGLWEGKAGAFGYQDGLDWVHIQSGSESNVVGLPMELLERVLASFAPAVLDALPPRSC